jgi:hypothetical protein
MSENIHFVVQKGMATCDKGMKFPKFKVTSHQKHYWNEQEGKEDYLAVTEDDLQFDPAAQPFGTQCKLQPSSSGYLPCSYAAAGKWTKTNDKVTILDKKCLTEESELMCAIGGKITVKDHGQSNQITVADYKREEEKAVIDCISPGISTQEISATTEQLEAY